MKVTTLTTGPAIEIINRHTEQITIQTQLIKAQQNQINELVRANHYSAMFISVLVTLLFFLTIYKLNKEA